ncbi:MAG: pyridoxal phosphate-dependent aminotransferase [Halobacteriales archaeon]
MVSPIEYLRWHGAHADGPHDLATSDQHAVAGEWGVVPDVLADRPDPPDEVTLRDQIAGEYGVDRDRVLVTAGATLANVAAFAAALGDGRPGADEGAGPTSGGGEGGRVLVESPGYEPLWATPAYLGATVDRFRRQPAEDFSLDADRIAGAAAAETDLVVATNRHNPSGRRVGRETLAEAAESTRDHGARLLVDEVYAPFGTTGSDGPFGGPTAAGLDGTVVTGSLTKFFGLGGLRVGWLIADPDFLERARRFGHHVPALATPSRTLARRALFAREELVALAREQLRANAALLVSFVEDRDDLTGPAFEGATHALLAHSAAGGDPSTGADGDAVAAAAADHGCTVAPGRFFDAPDRFRVSLGGDSRDMALALTALGDTLDGL